MTWKKLETNNDSKSWRFEENGDLEGEYVRSREAKSKKGKPITFHVFLRENGEIVSVLGGTVLDRIFSEQIKEGQKVKISFLGEVEGKNGPYKSYNVELWED